MTDVTNRLWFKQRWCLYFKGLDFTPKCFISVQKKNRDDVDLRKLLVHRHHLFLINVTLVSDQYSVCTHVLLV